MTELSLLRIGILAKGSPQTNESDTLTLSSDFQWLNLDSEVYGEG
jgi:hypothetical protein